ncbi:hypothetical protein [Burkholderia contaminans]|uniref:hypothetical protein n=1 Tax=Burkholderia contaminans TaxID=488447 RepID=UPI003BF85354
MPRACRQRLRGIASRRAALDRRARLRVCASGRRQWRALREQLVEQVGRAVLRGIRIGRRERGREARLRLAHQRRERTLAGQPLREMRFVEKAAFAHGLRKRRAQRRDGQRRSRVARRRSRRRSR